MEIGRTLWAFGAIKLAELGSERTVCLRDGWQTLTGPADILGTYRQVGRGEAEWDWAALLQRLDDC